MKTAFQLRESVENLNRAALEDEQLLNNVSGAKYFTEVTVGEEYDATGIIVGNTVKDGKRRYLVSENTHSLIIGSTGSGKTQCFFAPQIEYLAHSRNKPSMFVMDVKGELYRTKAQLLKDKGYKIYVYNFREPFSSARFNPLYEVYNLYDKAIKVDDMLNSRDGTEREFDGVTYDTHEEWVTACREYYYNALATCQSVLKDLATIISPIPPNVKDPIWSQGAQNIIFSAAYGMLEDIRYPSRGMTRDKYTIDNIINICYSTEDDCEAIKNWARAHGKKSEAYHLMSYYNLSAKMTRDSYVNVVNTALDPYANIPMRTLTATSDLNLNDTIGNIDVEPVAIFCITDEARKVTYDLCLMIINQLLSTLKECADHSGGSLKNDFHFLLDEFANCPKLEKIESYITTMRSRRVWLHLGVQSFDQLDNLYNEHVRNIIVDNCNTQIYFGCNNQKTTEEFSKAMGKKCVSMTSYSINHDGVASSSITAQESSLVKIKELKLLQLGQAFVRTFRRPALLSELNPDFTCDDAYHGNTIPPKVTTAMNELSDAFYDISELELNDDDNDDDDFSWSRSRRNNSPYNKLAEKIDLQERMFIFKYLDSLSYGELKQKAANDYFTLAPHSKALLDSGLFTLKLGMFVLALKPAKFVEFKGRLKDSLKK